MKLSYGMEMIKLVDISKKLSIHMFISNIKDDNCMDNNLYTKLNFIRNRKITKKCEEDKNGKY